jgi:putative membrane protein
VLDLVPLVATTLLVVAYGGGVLRLRRRAVAWPPGRATALVGGVACVAAAVLPPLGDHDDVFEVHVAQHLLLAMAAPALLALSAPVTLALRALPRRPRRVLLRAVQSAPVAVLTTPAVALLLDVGGLVLLYTTGTYALTLRHEWLHALVHLHLLLSGCLLAWVVLGVDARPRRPGFGVRLGTLVIAAAAHDTVSKLLYARDLPAGGGTTADRQVGAELMYYGGTVVELLTAVALMAQWYGATGRAHRRQLRRSGPSRPDAAGRGPRCAPAPSEEVAALARDRRVSGGEPGQAQ